MSTGRASSSSEAVPAPQSADRRGPAPLSFAQERLWFIEQLSPGSPAYNLHTTLRLTGPLDPDALHRSVQRLVDRHDVLRTTFHAGPDGTPFQRVTGALQVGLPVTELTTLSPDRRSDAARDLLAAWADEPFDLENGPLFRSRLVRLGPGEHILGLFLHHAVSDGWSVDLMFDEIAACYASPDGPAGQDEPAPQYAEFARRQREEELSPERLRRESGWWREYLAGAPRLLDLPLDRPRPAVPTGAGAAVFGEVDAPTMTRVSALAKKVSATPFMVLLACYGLLLARTCGQRGVLVGTPVAGRPRSEVHDVIGLFVNTVPVRVDLRPQDTFTDLVVRVRDSAWDALSHERMPFEKIVEAVRPERAAGTSPLVQTAFAAQTAPPRIPSFPGIEAEFLIVPPTTAKFDLELSLWPAADGDGRQELGITFNSDVFDTSFARQFADAYRHMLGAAVADPDARASGLPMMTPELRDTVLTEWSGSARRPAPAPFVHEAFSACAAADPAAPAVDFEGTGIDYGTLDRDTNRLAHCLRDLRVRPEEIVAVCLPRGLDQLRAILAVLKSGAAYLPLDPGQPTGRLLRLLRASGARHVLVGSDGVEDALRDGPAAVLRIDRIRTDVHPDTAPAPLTRPEHIAYTVFTSGSTGEPKGVTVSHGALANHAAAVRRRYGLGPRDRVTHFHPVNFDVAAEETYATWAAGGCVVVLPEPAPAPGELAALMEEQRITVTNLPSGYWARWMDRLTEDGTATPSHLRLMVIGSERAELTAVAAWRSRTDVPLLNAYGLTETTITSTVHAVNGPPGPPPLPVGTPLDGVEAYVLDAALEPVAPGVVGDLYLGGAGLARGYLGAPALTARRFVAHPFAARPGQRLHVTGDRARWTREGLLELHGRQDNQIKVRGYRVEPAEVESAILGYPAVRGAFVTASPDGSRLVAYLVLREPGDALDTLRRHLADRLPHHLVPNTFVTVGEIPLTPNGKIDRAALPAPESGPRTGPHDAPGTVTERLIAEIWQEVLGVEKVGRNDNFFDIGGHSMALGVIHSRLLRELGHAVPMVTLYTYPSVATLAAHLAGGPEPEPGPAANRLARARQGGRQRLLQQRRGRRGAGQDRPGQTAPDTPAGPASAPVTDE
ncbi:non-ribosomal peptide synthetase [Actinacidiphila glaucinigra]|uniref:non-ribosomal peptide synthetase n=1 Tax=Actinacidiphila glaucinigra TaxID=235986 RepID=UPI003D93810E